MRNCGECTACCDGWVTSKAVGLSPGVACKHCTVSGCAIYEDRPEDPCRTFKCRWLADPDGLDESLRPDKCGAIAKFTSWKSWTLLTLVPVGAQVPEATLKEMTSYAYAKALPLVWFERAKDFTKDHAVSKFAAGPEEFLAQVKWDFPDEDVFDLK